jgi:GTP-sensing pleiotropic transcriptional regulator CodY
MNIGPNTWGPYGWKFIHFIALAYPINPSHDDKINYYNFFNNLSNVLPCQLCIDNYKKHLMLYPLNDIVLSSNDKLLKWSIDMHNEINKLNNKKIYNYDTAINLIKNNYTEVSEPILEYFDNNTKVSEPILENYDNSTLVSQNNITKINNTSNNTLIYLFIITFIILIIIALLYK